MEPTDITIELLKSIRDEIRTTNERLDQTRSELSERIDQTNERIDQTNERIDGLAQRQAEVEIRLTTEIITLAEAVREVRDLLKDRLDLRDKVDDHEQRIRHLEGRLGA